MSISFVEILEDDIFAGAEVIAGEGGLRRVQQGRRLCVSARDLLFDGAGNLRQPECRCRKRLTGDQLLNQRNMSVINMCICDHMYELSDFHITYLRQHMDQYGILTYIPVICRKDIIRSLMSLKLF